LHGDEAVWANATNHAAEFVHVRVEHDARAGVALLRDDGAEAVVSDVVRERLEAVVMILRTASS